MGTETGLCELIVPDMDDYRRCLHRGFLDLTSNFEEMVTLENLGDLKSISATRRRRTSFGIFLNRIDEVRRALDENMSHSYPGLSSSLLLASMFLDKDDLANISQWTDEE